MPRRSSSDKQRSREAILAEASRRFRTDGIDNVSITEVMSGAGLTHGGFYRHFTSKDGLVADAITAAFEDTTAFFADQGRDVDLPSVLATFLRVEHRDQDDGGCPSACLGSQIPHQRPGARAAYLAGIRGMIRRIERAQRHAPHGYTRDFEDSDPDPSRYADPQVAVILSAMVGALTVARALATADPGLSEWLLHATRDGLIDRAV